MSYGSRIRTLPLDSVSPESGFSPRPNLLHASSASTLVASEQHPSALLKESLTSCSEPAKQSLPDDYVVEDFDFASDLALDGTPRRLLHCSSSEHGAETVHSEIAKETSSPRLPLQKRETRLERVASGLHHKLVARPAEARPQGKNSPQTSGPVSQSASISSSSDSVLPRNRIRRSRNPVLKSRKDDSKSNEIVTRSYASSRDPSLSTTMGGSVSKPNIDDAAIEQSLSSAQDRSDRTAGRILRRPEVSRRNEIPSHSLDSPSQDLPSSQKVEVTNYSSVRTHVTQQETSENHSLVIDENAPPAPSSDRDVILLSQPHRQQTGQDDEKQIDASRIPRVSQRPRPLVPRIIQNDSQVNASVIEEKQNSTNIPRKKTAMSPEDKNSVMNSIDSPPANFQTPSTVKINRQRDSAASKSSTVVSPRKVFSSGISRSPYLSAVIPNGLSTSKKSTIPVPQKVEKSSVEELSTQRSGLPRRSANPYETESDRKSGEVARPFVPFPLLFVPLLL